MVPFESFGAVSYSLSIVTMVASLAIPEIFNVKEWPDLEIWVWGRSWSLKMALFDRPCVTFDWSAIVTIALSCIIFELGSFKVIGNGAIAYEFLLAFHSNYGHYLVSFARYSGLFVENR